MNEPNESGDTIYRAPSSNTAVAATDDLLAAYVGEKKADYYTRVFDKFQRGDGIISWNWPAFFVTAFWLLYRKMWLNAFLYWFVLPIALTVLSGVIAALAFSDADTAGVAYVLAYYGSYAVIGFIVIPMLANWLYYRHAQKKVDRMAEKFPSQAEQAAALSQAGGTSRIIFVILPIVLVMLIGIIAAISIPAYQDYTVRAQVSEGLSLSSGAKAAATSYYERTGQLSGDNRTIGIAAPGDISGRYVSSVAYYDGEIVVTYGNESNPLLQGQTLVLEMLPTKDGVGWSCRSAGIAPHHLPAVCR